MASAVPATTSPRLGNAKRIPQRETRKRQPSISLFDSQALMQLKQYRDRSTSMCLSHCDEPAISVDLSHSLSSFGRTAPFQPAAKPRKVYQNTYKIEPDKRFEVKTVTSIIQQILSTLEDLAYDQERCKYLSKTLSAMILGRVKQLKYVRYRIVCSVSIGQLKDQGLHVVSRCIWDPDKDNYATAKYENSTLYAVGTVYAVYMD